jgi:hypothetical protein
MVVTLAAPRAEMAEEGEQKGLTAAAAYFTTAMVCACDRAWTCCASQQRRRVSRGVMADAACDATSRGRALDWSPRAVVAAATFFGMLLIARFDVCVTHCLPLPRCDGPLLSRCLLERAERPGLADAAGFPFQRQLVCVPWSGVQRVHMLHRHRLLWRYVDSASPVACGVVPRRDACCVTATVACRARLLE